MEGIGVLAILICSISVTYAVNSCPGPEAWSENVFLQHDDCQKFYKCVFGQPIEMSCSAGLYFNLETSQCDWKANVNCPNDEPDQEQGSQFLENGCPRNFSVHWLLPHENDCNFFYTCISGRKLKQRCPGSLHFDFKEQICGWPKPEGCTTSNEDSSSEIDSSENNPSKEENSIEDNTKEDTSKEDNSNEDASKEDISVENDTDENDSEEDSSSENSQETISSEEDVTTENDSGEDISKESNTNENHTEEDVTKEDDTDEDVSKESVSNEDTSGENDSSKDVTSEEDTAEEDTSKDDIDIPRNIKKIEAIVDVNVLKEFKKLL